ncbi:MAG: BlaI/MecI/CopY family transcriptional regulator [bacterium]|nr:BlaI/MecI/CopY family transcriptional regulator [bacterium]
MGQSLLTNAELAVLELLWEQGELTARQIREHLYPEAQKAQHGTVQRFLQSLEEKGCVLRDRALAVHVFAAALSREAYAGQQLESLADRLTGGSIAPFLTHLLQEKKISRAELARLRKLLDGAGGGRSRRG